MNQDDAASVAHRLPDAEFSSDAEGMIVEPASPVTIASVIKAHILGYPGSRRLPVVRGVPA